MIISSSRGLSSTEAQKLLEQFGKNIIKTKRKKLLIVQFLEELKDIMVLILIAAAVISFVVGEKKDGSVIVFIVILNAVIGFIQKFRAEKAVEALQKLLAPQARIMRDGKEKIIPAEEVVPGDLLILNEGDRIAADAFIIEENEFGTQEAVLTGESVPVKKHGVQNGKNNGGEGKDINRVFMGTTVAHGNAKAIVEHTGMETKFGTIAHLTAVTEKDLSPLQKELNYIGIFISKITLAIAGILVLAGTLIQGKPLIKTILFAASVAVAAVPEGLPATVTIALALGVQKLARKKAIVKELASVETLGSTTVIVSDKTGTLTKNEMTVKQLVLKGHEIILSEEKYVPNKELIEPLTLICSVCTLCNNAKITEDGSILGDPTEGALLKLVDKIGLTNKVIQEKFQKIHEYPFDSKRKRMSVIAEKKDSKNRYILTKGAPNEILEICTHILIDGKTQTLTNELKEKMLEKNDQMASSALRVIALAYKNITGIKEKISQEEVEKDMIFLGLTGMIDPPRIEIPKAIKAAEKAGIRVFIVTGDHGLTAAAIAKMIGLIKEKEEYTIVTSELLETMKQNELKSLLKQKERKVIFARVSPEDKLKIVDALKDLKEIVAVTGDGVNDAPALKRSDIGIAMGIAGTDVSREAANIVLADDSFATIVDAIEEGRTIYENLKKFLIYILSSNVGELLVIFVALITGLVAPLTAILILLVNVGTDVLPALALGVDPAEKEVMEKPPRKPGERILQKKFLSRMIFLGFFVGIVSLSAYLWSLYENGWMWGIEIAENSELYKKASTMAFVTLVLGQMANAYNARSTTVSAFKNFFKNFTLLGAILFSIILTIAVTKIDFLQNYLSVTELTGKEWVVATVGALIVVVVEEIRKMFARSLRAAKS